MVSKAQTILLCIPRSRGGKLVRQNRVQWLERHLPVNHPRVVTPRRPGRIQFSICTLVNNDKKYRASLADWRQHGFRGADCEFLFCDNREGNQYDGFQSSRLFLDAAQGKYVVLTHQDSRPRTTKTALLQILEDLEKLDPRWAIVGNAGVQQATLRFVTLGLVMPNYSQRKHEEEYVQVEALDENLLIVKAEARLSLSHDLKGFHLYGLDLSDVARRLGRTCYVAKMPWYHGSHGTLNGPFYRQVRIFEKKMREYRRFRLLGTNCTFLSWSRSGFHQAWARARACWLLRKNEHHTREESEAVWRQAVEHPLIFVVYPFLWIFKKSGLEKWRNWWVRDRFRPVVRKTKGAQTLRGVDRRGSLALLIPSHKHGPYLHALLASVDRQTRQPDEILVSEDASRDGSWEQLRVWARGRAGVRLYRQPRNLGITANSNFLLKKARSEHILFLHSDDLLLEPWSLQRLEDALCGEGGLAAAACGKRFLNEKGDPSQREAGLVSGIRAGSWVIRRILWTEKNIVGEPSCVMFRRSLLPGGFDPGLHQLWDVEAWLRVLSRGDLAYLAEPLVGIRRHAAQATRQNAKKGLLIREHLTVFGHALEKEWGSLPPGERYRLLYKLGQTVRRNPGAANAEIRNLLARRRRQMGTVQYLWQKGMHRFGVTRAP